MVVVVDFSYKLNAGKCLRFIIHVIALLRILAAIFLQFFLSLEDQATSLFK